MKVLPLAAVHALHAPENHPMDSDIILPEFLEWADLCTADAILAADKEGHLELLEAGQEGLELGSIDHK